MKKRMGSPFIVIFTLCATGDSVTYAALPPEVPISVEPVRTRSGLVQGVSEDGLTVYKGIPFAAPPIGNLRWREPNPAKRWEGILRATEFKPACMQEPLNIPGLAIQSVSEDCLYLNIWTPAKSAGDKLAVMVWLYGGGDSHGSGSERLYWGDQLAKKGVVVVTLNYRVLAFGLLAHPELTKESAHHASGNYLLLDEIAALRWVQENIAAFGGDPGNVTLFGQSAGAYQVSTLMVSPLTLGLFRRAIGESGGEFSPDDPTLAQAEHTGVAYARQLNAHSIAEMRKVPAGKIVAFDMRTPEPGGVSGINRGNVDGYVVPRDVYQLFTAGQQHDVDLLVGYTAEEGANTSGPSMSAEKYIEDTHERFGVYADRVLAIFPASSGQQAAQSQVRVNSADHAWRMETWARLHSKSTTKKVFFYRFSHVPPFPPYKQLNAAGHGAELPYVFGYPPGAAFSQMEPALNASRDVLLAEQIQTYWTNFAKTGDPNGPGLPQWPVFSAGEKILDFGDSPSAIGMPHPEEYALIDAYYAEQRALSGRK